jgi:hypothetical protein
MFYQKETGFWFVLSAALKTSSIVASRFYIHNTSAAALSVRIYLRIARIFWWRLLWAAHLLKALQTRTGFQQRAINRVRREIPRLLYNRWKNCRARSARSNRSRFFVNTVTSTPVHLYSVPRTTETTDSTPTATLMVGVLYAY